jgi:hypothetical protein
MREVALAAVVLFSLAPLTGHALIVETIELDAVTLDSFGWYTARLLTFDDPATPDGDVFFRGIATVTLDDWTHVSLSFTTWDAVERDLVGGVIVVAHADETGVVAETRALGDTPLAPIVEVLDARTLELNVFSGACCGRGHVVLIAGGDGAVESVRFSTHGNPFVVFEASASGIESFSALDDDFEAVAHAAVLAPQVSSEVRVMLAGRAVAEAADGDGEFVGALAAFSDMGDAPDWCHLRIVGPALEVESQPNGDAVCVLIGHSASPGRYELRVERLVAPNLFSDNRADALAHGAFVTFP